MGADGPADARVALVIPTLDGGPRFVEALARWRAQKGVGAIDICCPDSGSQDGSRQAIVDAGGRVLPIPPAEFNHGDTRNRAVAATKADFVILSVQDALPMGEDLAEQLVRPLEDDPNLSATYGRQVAMPDCHPVMAARIGNWIGSTEPVVQELGERSWDELEPLERLGLIRYDHVIACMRRSEWERHRFEPVAMGEDVRWSTRVIRSGGTIAFVPGATVEHSHDRSPWYEFKRIYADHRNLSDLLGLRTLTSRRQIPDSVRGSREHYARIIEDAAAPDEETERAWREWAHKLAAYECWAQYLGANYSHRWWFRPIDRWLRGGI